MGTGCIFWPSLRSGITLGPLRRGAESDAPPAGVLAQLDPRDLLGGHADATAPPVGQPEHAAAGGEGLLDLALQPLAIGLVGQLDLELLAGVNHADANYQCRCLLRLGLGLGRRLRGRRGFVFSLPRFVPSTPFGRATKEEQRPEAHGDRAQRGPLAAREAEVAHVFPEEVLDDAHRSVPRAEDDDQEAVVAVALAEAQERS